MDSTQAVDIAREAIWTALLVASPVLISGLVVGLLIGLIQALTQVQEQTVAFVPKIIAMVLALSITLPWVVGRMIEYSSELIGTISQRL